MTRPEDSIPAQEEKNCRHDQLKNTQRKDILNGAQNKNGKSYCGGVSNGNRQQSSDDCQSALFLKANGRGEQPTHGGIQAVVGPEKCQRHPGPGANHRE